MLFVFDPPRAEQVWMAGMTIPLDAAWIVDGKVAAIRTLQPCRAADQARCPRWNSPTAVEFLLEVPAGGLDDVAVGARVAVVEEGS